VRLDFDAIIRDMILILMSWDERISDVQHLSRPYTRLSLRQRDEVVLPAAVVTLTAHFDRLLVLPPQPMMRVRSLRSVADLPPGTPSRVHADAGYAEILVDLDGTSAGLELIDLNYKARRALRATNPPPEKLDGVPCRQCDHLALERAAPSRSEDSTDYWSECALCGNLLTRDEYVAWVRMYAAWVQEQQTLPLLEAS
jgi:hypothetical protein